MTSKVAINLAAFTFAPLSACAGLFPFVLIGVPSSAYCQQETTKLPTANEVVNRFMQKRGGVEFLSSISSMHTLWTKSDSEGEWEFERWQIPGQSYAERRVNGEIKTTYGCWVANPMESDKLLKGVSWWEQGDRTTLRGGEALRESAARIASIDNSTRWLDRSESIKCQAIETIEGKSCYHLQFKEENGTTSDRYFDVESGLLVSTISNEHETGGSRVTRQYADYKDFDGILMPTKQTIISDSGTDAWTLKKLEHEIDLDMEQFHVPGVAQVEIDRLSLRIEVVSGQK